MLTTNWSLRLQALFGLASFHGIAVPFPGGMVWVRHVVAARYMSANLHRTAIQWPRSAALNLGTLTPALCALPILRYFDAGGKADCVQVSTFYWNLCQPRGQWAKTRLLQDALHYYML